MLKLNKKILISLLFICVMIGLFYSKPVQAAETAGLNNNWVYVITNKYSRKCLNVNFGTDANGTNVTQYVQDGSLEQKFKLVYNSSNSAYKLYPMCRTGGSASRFYSKWKQC